ncbi:sulfatase-like hydrolase/transferase [Fodinicurvata sediminis]|uniref:sulfatase-like hydrolase/transferase n=1 Tax=Fodinicurvata sediminis TaxID=1121832 RepID=UPI0003B309B0|nr:sulfatase-like hydrolase/transferase [Fodinicurvata sediminis]
MKLFKKATLERETAPASSDAGQNGGLPVFLMAICFFWLLFSLPGLLHGWNWRTFRLPLEVVVIVAGYALLPRSTSRYLRWPLALLIFSAALVLFLDQALRVFFGRPLNLMFDINLLQPGLELLWGATGPLLSGLLLLALATALLLVLYVCSRALSILEPVRAPRMAICVLALVLVAGHLPATQRHQLPITAELTHSLTGQVQRVAAVIRERPQFKAALARERYDDGIPENALGALSDTNVILIFVESYGRQALENTGYAETTAAALKDLQHATDAKEIKSVSGWAQAPTIGGQSWLSHASFLSGLWVDNQIKYQLLSESERLTLAKAFSDSGHESALVMPAITRAWPEAGFMGFDRYIFARDMGYAGKPYNWVTMPDQYTLSHFDQAVRKGAQPFFAMLALISSHAPWTPIAPVLDDWTNIGDGTIFSRWADQGESPASLWQDPGRVREHYAQSIDYVLRTLASYIRNVSIEKDPFLMVVLGDHEAGAIASGPDAASEVPVHILSNREELLEPFDHHGFTQGMHPKKSAAIMQMHDFRDFFIENYQGKKTQTVSTK